MSDQDLIEVNDVSELSQKKSLIYYKGSPLVAFFVLPILSIFCLILSYPVASGLSSEGSANFFLVFIFYIGFRFSVSYLVSYIQNFKNFLIINIDEGYVLVSGGQLSFDSIGGFNIRSLFFKNYFYFKFEISDIESLSRRFERSVHTDKDGKLFTKFSYNVDVSTSDNFFSINFSNAAQANSFIQKISSFEV